LIASELWFIINFKFLTETLLTEHVHQGALSIDSKLKFGIIITISVLAIEIVGGLLSNSLALLSDAGHVFADILALALSWYGIRQTRRPASSRMTFGYHRIGVLIAITNALSIFAIAGIIFYEAYIRFQHPLEVKSILMLSVAVAGLGANIFVAFWLRTEQRDNLNVRSAFWHALGDALASIGVIIGGVIILFTGWFWIDPIISALIGIIIFLAAWQIFKEGMRVLLEATPSGVDIVKMINVLKRMPSVKDIHDVHVWSISPELRAMSCHVVIDDVSTSQAADTRREIEKVVEQQFHIKHITVQMECQQCNPNDLFCTLTIHSEDKEDRKPSSHQH